MKSISTTLKTERFELRHLKPTFENSKKVYDLIIANMDFYGFLPFLQVVDSVESEYNFLKMLDDNLTKQEQFSYFIFENNNLIGNIGVQNISQFFSHGEVGYWLSKESAGKGVITESLEVIENEFFSGDGLNCLRILADIFNNSSIKVAEKNGYKFEGTLRDYRYYPSDKKFHDYNSYSKLKNEWNK